MPPETRYALSRGAHIAYQVVGEGALDIVFVPSYMSNIELGWESPKVSAFMMRLARFSRLIQFDRRGNGMSDSAPSPSTLEDQVDDVRAVLKAAGSERPAVVASMEGATLALLFAASHPASVRALVLGAPLARLVRGPGYEWAPDPQVRAAAIEKVIEAWGQDSDQNPWFALMGVEGSERENLARFQRLSAGPGDAAAILAFAAEIDVRDVLPSIQSPTLVMRRRGDTWIDARHSRYVAEHVPGAQYLEIGGDGPVWAGEAEEPCREIEAFLTGTRPAEPSERVLATVLFTDIVGSTERAASVGDAAWRELLAGHDQLVAREVERHRGRMVKSLGDGALALFDGPSRALGCALAVRDGVRDLGLSIRAGLHTGECELLGAEDVGGIAIHIAARIAAMAEGEEVLASSTVRDLTVGSPYALEERGEHVLKGVEQPWRVFAAAYRP